MRVEKIHFGNVGDVVVDLFTLENENGMKVQVTNYGATVTSICVPDKNGESSDIVTGFDNLDDYVKGCPYFGSIVGRYGNRIANGRFELDGKKYELATNNGPNHLHGGNVGFDKVVWDAKEIQDGNSVGVQLSYLSKDGEEGYPGNLSITLTYSITNENELKMTYEATTDKTTVCNLTNHTYFNLKDGGETTVLNHELMIDAAEFLPVDVTSIPYGKSQAVVGTIFDFNNSAIIDDRIHQEDEQLINGKGFDHCYLLNGDVGQMRLVANVSEASSGRIMEVHTDQPGIQCYTGNYLDGSLIGRNGVVYQHRNALCLETQHYPNSPNQADYPSTVLRPEEKYQTSTIYKFKSTH